MTLLEPKVAFPKTEEDYKKSIFDIHTKQIHAIN